MRSFRNVFKVIVLAGLAAVFMGPSAQAARVRPNSAFTNFIRSVRAQERANLIAVRLSAQSQLLALTIQRNQGAISTAQFRQERASLISNYRLANNTMRNLIRTENNNLRGLQVQFRTGQLTFEQFQAQAGQVISVAHAQQLALIAKVQQGLVNPATPFS